MTESSMSPILTQQEELNYFVALRIYLSKAGNYIKTILNLRKMIITENVKLAGKDGWLALTLCSILNFSTPKCSTKEPENLKPKYVI